LTLVAEPARAGAAENSRIGRKPIIRASFPPYARSCAERLVAGFLPTVAPLGRCTVIGAVSEDATDFEELLQMELLEVQGQEVAPLAPGVPFKTGGTPGGTPSTRGLRRDLRSPKIVYENYHSHNRNHYRKSRPGQGR